MLLELESFDGVVIFTTTLFNNYDDAFKRRILASIKFKLPGKDGREAIWKSHLPIELPKDDEITTRMLSERYEEISGADIKDITLMAATKILKDNRDKVSITDFDYGYNIIKNRYNKDVYEKNNVKVTHERISTKQYLQEMNMIDNKES